MKREAVITISLGVLNAEVKVDKASIKEICMLITSLEIIKGELLKNIEEGMETMIATGELEE